MGSGPTVAIREQCPLATPNNDGLMSKEQAAYLSGSGSLVLQKLTVNKFLIPQVNPPLELIIYVRTGGNDSTGNGSLAKPYATIPRALQDVPTVSDGNLYTLDITGITATLSEELFINNLKGPHHTIPGPNGVFDIRCDLNFFASLSLLATLNPAATVSVDSVTGILTVTGVTQTWTVNQWVGKFLVDSTGGSGGVICSNTATSLKVEAPNSLVGQLFIKDTGASITIAPNQPLFIDTLSIGSNISVSFQGVHLTNDPTNSGQGLVITNTAELHSLFCHLEGFTCSASVIQDIRATYLSDPSYAPGCDFACSSIQEITFIYCLFDGTLGGGRFNNTSIAASWFNCAFLNCHSVGSDDGSESDDFRYFSWIIFNCDFLSTTNGIGIAYFGGNSALVTNTRIENAGTAIFCKNPGRIYLQNVVGSVGNTIGVSVVNGCRVEVGDGISRPTPTVTGTNGDFKVGLLPPRSWSSLLSGHPTNQEYDISGDGSRLSVIFAAPEVALPVEGVGAPITAASTIAPVAAIHHVSGATNIATITPPTTTFTGSIRLIPGAGGINLVLGGNIAKASTGIQNQTLEVTFDGSLWYPSY